LSQLIDEGWALGWIRGNLFFKIRRGVIGRSLAIRNSATVLSFQNELTFILPSRYCEVDSELLGFAWNRFGAITPGWSRVQAICDFVHSHLRFDHQMARANRIGRIVIFRGRDAVDVPITHGLRRSPIRKIHRDGRRAEVE